MSPPILPASRQPRSRLRSLLFRCVAVLLGLSVAAGVEEVGLRVAGYSRTYFNPLSSFHEGHALVGYRGKPNFVGWFRQSEFGVIVAHDEQGFRRQEHQNPRSECRRKVLVFGDSFTWGWGVGQGEVLTDRMSLAMPGYLVRNFGLNASGTAEQFIIFQAHGKEDLSPLDTVVLLFCSNDFRDNTSSMIPVEVRDGEVHGVGAARQKRSALKDALKDASYLLNLIFYSADRAGAILRQRRGEERVARIVDLGESTPEVVVTRHFLEAFRKTCADLGARFVAAYIPRTSEWCGSPHPLDAVYRKAFFDAVGSLGIEAIDLLPAFVEARGSGGRDSLAFPTDGHWNARGHAVAAAVIAASILKHDRAAEETGK